MRTRSMVRSSWAIALLILALSAPAGAQGPWSRDHTMDHLPGVILKWRIIEKHKRAEYNFIQLRYVNTLDRPITFSYIFKSELGERRTGMMTLGPGKDRLSGCYFRGREIAQLDGLETSP